MVLPYHSCCCHIIAAAAKIIVGLLRFVGTEGFLCFCNKYCATMGRKDSSVLFNYNPSKIPTIQLGYGWMGFVTCENKFIIHINPWKMSYSSCQRNLIKTLKIKPILHWLIKLRGFEFSNCDLNSISQALLSHLCIDMMLVVCILVGM